MKPVNKYLNVIDKCEDDKRKYRKLMYKKQQKTSIAKTENSGNKA